MKYATTLLWITAALFLAFGMGFILAPAFFSQLITGASPSTSSGLADMRATYGGISLGLAIFWGWCAQQTGRVRSGLISSMLVLGFVAFGRLIGMIVDGTPNVFMFVLFAAEVLFAALVFAASKKIKTK